MEDNNAQSNTTDQTPKTESMSPTQESPASSAPSPATPTLEPAKTELPKPEKGSKKKLGVMLLLLVLLLAIPAALYAGNTMSTQKSDKKVAALNSQIALLQASEHDLPAGAFKVSDCIPNMGAHYLTKTSDKEYGPFLLVNKQQKVIGIEYMFDSTMYTAIPKTDPPVEVITKDSPMYGWKYDHSDVSHMSKGHEGLLRDHIDIHMYTVTKEQQKNACK